MGESEASFVIREKDEHEGSICTLQTEVWVYPIMDTGGRDHW